MALLLLAATTVGAQRPGPSHATPNDVYSAVLELERVVDAALDARQVPVGELPVDRERGLGPMHVYQLALACVPPLQRVQEQHGLRQLPTIVASPRTYEPRDVLFVVETLLHDARAVAACCGAETVPSERARFDDKVPTDVFHRLSNVFVKLLRLGGVEKISPNEVYAEVVRAAADVRSILRQTDPACRYRIDAPAPRPGRRPADVFVQCLEARRQVNSLRTTAGLPAVALPVVDADAALRPRDVYLQVQILIAEMNLLKMFTGTASSTPLAIPVTDRSPTDVFGELLLFGHLLDQVLLDVDRPEPGK